MTEGGQNPIPLTPSQKLIWTGQSLAPDVPLYSMVWRIRYRGDLDPVRFSDAWAEVVKQSDALRVRIEDNEGTPRQFLTGLAPRLEVHDMSREADAESVADAWIEADKARPVDLSLAAWRSRLFRLSDHDWIWYLNQHHIATDASSGAVLMQRMADAYSGIRPANMPQFEDYARSIDGASKDVSEAVRRYWSGMASGFRPMTPPYGVDRKADDATSRRWSIPFGAARSAAMNALLEDRRFTAISRDLAEFALWASVYAAWLHRVTGDSTVRIGTPFHNRMSPAQKQTIGLFIEMFPLALQVEAGDSLVELFKRSLAAVIDYLRHAKPGASTAESVAAFNAVINFIPIKMQGLPGLKTDIRWLHPGAHDGAQDLRLHIYDFNATGTYTVELDTSSLISDMAEDAIEHFLAVIDGVLANPDRPLDSIALTRKTDTHLKGTPNPDVPASVLDAIARHAKSTRPAVICGDEALSHAQVAELSGGYATELARLGVRPGSAVAVWCARSLRLPVALLGVLKAGSYFVPIPAGCPPERARAILTALSPSAIITDESTQRAVFPPGTPALAIDADLPSPSELPGAGESAYVIYTSGSTGIPKGVEVGHREFARYIDWAARSYGPQGPKSYAFFSGIGFDLTLTSLFVPLVTGGTIRVYPETPGNTDLAVLDVFSEDAVDVVKLTPSHLSLVAVMSRPLKRISTLVVGGENLTTSACSKALASFGPHVRIANEYGPTEAVVGCMIHWFDPDADKGLSVPIGRPAEDVEIRVLDAGFNLVPRGVTGELHIGGKRLARGYLGDPELTSDKFWECKDGSRQYASGDLARVRSDGVVEYLGRADRQLKISGVRVEPAEIEAALLERPDVSAAHAVVWAPDTKETRCIRCGLSSSVPGVSFDAEDVCSICREYESIRDDAQAYFDTPDALSAELSAARQRRKGRFDAIMLLSGGKDSAYALYRLAGITRDVLVLTLDNGFISDGAKENIRRICLDLGLEHRFLTTPDMNEIFRESLKRFSNVCQGCFKTIYALALKVARDEGIPAIVTGLSRGQFFETRLTPELFRGGRRTREELDAIVLAARKSYHHMDDAVARLLKTRDYLDDELLDEVRFIDIYRYIDVPVSEIYQFLTENAPWVRPEDTGRSTNCLINDLGIHVHKEREGYHNYALPYSWDVRLGHKTREQALDELDDDIDPEKLKEIKAAVGFDALRLPARRGGVVAYVASDAKVAELRAHLAARLSRDRMPKHIVALDRMPLTANGKVDEACLPRPDPTLEAPDSARVQPTSETEKRLHAVFCDILGASDLGVTDDFYEIGGDSIAAIQIALAASEVGLRIASTAVFEHPTIRALAASIDGDATNAGSGRPPGRRSGPLIDLGSDDLAALGRARLRKERERGS